MGIFVLLVLLFLLFGLISYAFTIYNGLIRVSRNIEKAWANIDVILKQRHDEIPKLIKICEQFSQYERGTLERVIELRTAAMNATGVADKAVKEGNLTKALGGIWAVGEAYPDLKSNNNIHQLQTRISGLESELADRRELYNDSVNIYNIRINQVPDMIIANMLSYREKEMFRISEDEKKDVDISLNLPK
ncbi:MAG: LemA family protein [bacterium]|nr:LemA family protein [bacterium]MDD5756699.1 LemA family protein [bacterium]